MASIRKLYELEYHIGGDGSGARGVDGYSKRHQPLSRAGTFPYDKDETMYGEPAVRDRGNASSATSGNRPLVPKDVPDEGSPWDEELKEDVSTVQEPRLNIGDKVRTRDGAFRGTVKKVSPYGLYKVTLDPTQYAPGTAEEFFIDELELDEARERPSRAVLDRFPDAEEKLEDLKEIFDDTEFGEPMTTPNGWLYVKISKAPNGTSATTLRDVRSGAHISLDSFVWMPYKDGGESGWAWEASPDDNPTVIDQYLKFPPPVDEAMGVPGLMIGKSGDGGGGQWGGRVQPGTSGGWSTGWTDDSPDDDEIERAGKVKEVRERPQKEPWLPDHLQGLFDELVDDWVKMLRVHGYEEAWLLAKDEIVANTRGGEDENNMLRAASGYLSAVKDKEGLKEMKRSAWTILEAFVSLADTPPEEIGDTQSLDGMELDTRKGEFRSAFDKSLELVAKLPQGEILRLIVSLDPDYAASEFLDGMDDDELIDIYRSWGDNVAHGTPG